MFTPKADKKLLYVASPGIIITTGMVEYNSPPGICLCWAYVLAVFMTKGSQNTRLLLFSVVLSSILIIITILNFPDASATTARLNHTYALAGIFLTAAFVYSSITQESKAEDVRIKMDGIFSHGTQGIVLMDGQGNISLLNPYAESMFGYYPGELLGRNIKALIPGVEPVDLPEKRNLMPHSGYVTAMRKDGTSFPAEISVNSYASAHGLHVVAFINDVSARKENEEKLQARKAELEAVNKELEAFSYSVSHDLRAPLRAVCGYSKMLGEDYSALLDDEGRRLLSVIGTSAEQMGALIDDLLAFSRLGKKEIKKTRVDINELVQATLRKINMTMPNNARITISELHPAMADRPLVAQVIENILSNAIKYSSKKEEPIIRIDSRLEGDHVVYSIRDNGAGFDMEYVEKLFGVFQRLHPSEEFEGTGVGLAIAQRIIQKHGGTIWGVGKEGEGATFSFTLPSAAATEYYSAHELDLTNDHETI